MFQLYSLTEGVLAALSEPTADSEIGPSYPVSLYKYMRRGAYDEPVDYKQVSSEGDATLEKHAVLLIERDLLLLVVDLVRVALLEDAVLAELLVYLLVDLHLDCMR